MPATAKVRSSLSQPRVSGTHFSCRKSAVKMLPLVDKPIIQYGVEEAIHSGITNIIMVTGRGKTAIEDHFDVSFELEHLLESRRKKDLLALVRQVSDLINVAYTRQKEARGLGHAVLCARELVGEEPFATVCQRRNRRETPTVGAGCSGLPSTVAGGMQVPENQWKSSYGCIDAEPVSHNGNKNKVIQFVILLESRNLTQHRRISRSLAATS